MTKTIFISLITLMFNAKLFCSLLHFIYMIQIILFRAIDCNAIIIKIYKPLVIFIENNKWLLNLFTLFAFKKLLNLK